MTQTPARRMGRAGICLIGGLVCGARSAAAVETPRECAKPSGTYTRTYAATPATLRRVLAEAEGGSVITLTTGDYGNVILDRVNAEFVTLTPAKGQNPIFSGLSVKGSHWIVKGVAIVGLSPPHLAGAWQWHGPLVKLGDGDNFILEGDTIASRLGDFPWAPETAGVADTAAVSTGIQTSNSSCVTISRNHLYNLFNAIKLEGDQVENHGKYYRIENNNIDQIAGDGIDHSVSFALIKGNIITNTHDICDNMCIHTDGIQGWNYWNKLGIINYDVKIEGNIIIQQTIKNLPLPADKFQGITIFDGFWKNLSVINNVIVTDVWHGIYIAGADGLLIANNTVLASTDRKTWIQAGGVTHEGGTSSNLVVRNNIGTSISLTKATPPATNAVFDHNLIATDPARLFVKFDPANAQYDLHLRPGSEAAGRGSPNGAPAVDVEGKPRSSPVSLGAYQ